mmetsp:Transcript_26317/g.56447  ORF Transcript_26317/g.56447 Transcript_26317/m.56447 type:complete len:89 (+) Transcript_26317:29-295(+)
MNTFGRVVVLSGLRCRAPTSLFFFCSACNSVCSAATSNTVTEQATAIKTEKQYSNSNSTASPWKLATITSKLRHGTPVQRLPSSNTQA